MARFRLMASWPEGYELFPVSRRLAKRYEKATGHESVLFQTDWDFPGLARTLGHRPKGSCAHRSTDGTVKCEECGKTASSFIEEAVEWLDKQEGRAFNDPHGTIAEYFGEVE